MEKHVTRQEVKGQTAPVGRRSAVGSFGRLPAAEREDLPQGYIHRATW